MLPIIRSYRYLPLTGIDLAHPNSPDPASGTEGGPADLVRHSDWSGISRLPAMYQGRRIRPATRRGSDHRRAEKLCPGSGQFWVDL